MIYDVEFSLDAAAELLRIAQVLDSASLVLRAADEIRRRLENERPRKRYRYVGKTSTGIRDLRRHPPLKRSTLA